MAEALPTEGEILQIQPSEAGLTGTVRKRPLVPSGGVVTRLHAQALENAASLVSSTPLSSPTKEIQGGHESYMTTPLTESVGTQLLSRQIPKLPNIEGDMTSNDLLKALDAFEDLIVFFDAQFTLEEGADKSLPRKFNNLYARANRARLVAAEREDDDTLHRCTDIMSKIEGLKMKLNMANHNFSEGSNALHGFDSFDFFKAASRLPSSNTHAKIIKELSRKISDMEHVVPAIHVLTEQVSTLTKHKSTGNFDINPSIATKTEEISELVKSAIEIQNDLKIRVSTLETDQSSVPAVQDRVAQLETSVGQVKQTLSEHNGNLEKISKSLRQLTVELVKHEETTSKDIENLQACVSALFSNTTTRVCDNPTNGLVPDQSGKSQLSVREQRTQHWINSQNDVSGGNAFIPVVPRPLHAQTPCSNQSLNTVDQTGFNSMNGNTSKTNENLIESSPRNEQEQGNPVESQQQSNHGSQFANRTHVQSGDQYIANSRTQISRQDIESNQASHGNENNRYQERMFHESIRHHELHREITNDPLEQHQGGSQRFDGQNVFSPRNPDNRDHLTNEADDSTLHSISSESRRFSRGLKRQKNALRRLLLPEPSESLDKPTLLDIYKCSLPNINAERKELQHMLRDYMKSKHCDNDLIEEIEDVLDDADDWCAKMRRIYQNKGLHKKSQNGKLYETLPKFHPESEIDIFEFLRRFENLTAEYEIPSEQAELFFSKYLSDSLQDEVVMVKENYMRMKAILMHRYGDLRIITDNILAPVVGEKVPSGSDLKTKLHYFRKLQSALQKVNKLLQNPDIAQDEVQLFLYSHDFLKRILHLLPEEAINYYVESMSNLNQDITRVRGQVAFKTLLSSVQNFYERYDSMARNTELDLSEKSKGSKDRDKTKSKNTRYANHLEARNDNNDSSEGEIEVLPKPAPTQNVLYQGNQKKKEKPVLKKKFPCTLTGHKHGLSECSEFFMQNPKERAEQRKNFKFKHCYLCLQSNADCTAKSCANLEKIPKALVCPDCLKGAKEKRKACYSVLFCYNETHVKPSNNDILKALEEYLPSFDRTLLNAPVSLAGHFHVLAGTKLKPESASLSSPVDPEKRAPIFNTSTGDQDTPVDIDMIDEVNEDSIGVMQILSLNGRQVLTLFDRGANQHLISGPLAEDLGIKVISQKQSSVGVISGDHVWTGYGSYELYLGPTTEGKYYQLKAHGMKEITGTFPKYDLAKVNAETREHSDLAESTPLPPSIGGDTIKLLIGLKRTDLEPVCIFNLPSGIGLYRSPFKDVHGSVYCYGGPHRMFSDVNKKVGGNVNHLYSYFTQLVNQYKSSPFLSLRAAFEPEILDSGHGICFEKDPCITYSFNSTSGQGFYPTPLTKCDLEELGHDVNDDFDIDTTICPEAHCNCPTTNWVFKAKIPLVKQKSFMDEEDKDDLVNYRCEKCMKCKCASSSTARMMSLTEQIEQEAIEKSVTVNLGKRAVYVDLPFTKPPGDFLKAKHGDDNNFSQAHKVYKSQCRQPEQKKESIRKVHADLVSKGFMKKLDELPPEHQDLIAKAPFRHYMPWRTVSKDSASTPLRLVVDPSMSGLNLILAKGENKMKKMNDIMLRSRTKKFMWSSDISKLYNCLKLNPSSYAYQLFLYHESLDPDIQPQIYVMLVAWYGVTSSSNQAIFALEELARLQKEEFPLAYIVLSEDIFVDDILSGSDNMEERKDQISQVETVLDSGGFKVKFVILSGESTDQGTVKVLGYVWNPVSDTLSPGFNEINFNKKKRGLKNPNPFPINTPEDVAKLVSTTQVTRRMVISKIAELWEPIGMWEPYKLQLKLAAQTLNGYEWDAPLPIEAQCYWSERFKEFLQIPYLSIQRYVFPDQNIQIDSNIRLICVSDAAANAGGAAIYAGRKVQGNTFSCQLLTSKSKLMSYTIPRNELEAIRIGANLANEAKNALGSAVTEVIFFTDSSIAMSWCHNTNKKLRLFVLNRVSEIRRIIKSITGSTDLPLFHIDGKLNTADLLTKPNSLKPAQLQSDSSWMAGHTWMNLSLDKMPVMRFSDIQLSAQQDQQIDEECFPEILFPDATPSAHSFLLSKGGKGLLPLVDIIHYGYPKSLEIMACVIDFTWTLKHMIHKKRGVEHSHSCRNCQAIEASNGTRYEHRKILKSEAQKYFLRLETAEILKSFPKHKVDKFKSRDGILYASSRLPEEAEVSTKDLDFNVFFDNTTIKGVLPIVRAESDIFFAILMHVHHRIRKHSGNEITMREVTKIVYPIGNYKKMIQEVRKNCPRCRLIIKKTLELEMGNHPEARLQIAPVFYHCMADICYGFKGKPHKNARTSVKIYALVIVCLLTSATSILALEGLETQDVVLALERHSALHGVPATIYVDQGTQLVSLDKVSLSLRDANHQLRKSLGLEIIPSAAKSHEERGRVERKIRTLREMLRKTAVNTDIAMTALQWETIFSKMASEIDDLPIARADKAPNSDIGWQLLTPNRLKLGRSNNRAIEGPMTISSDTGPVQLLKRVQDIQAYWYQLLLDRLHHLIPKPEKWSNSDEVKIGDVIILKLLDNPNPKLEKWSIGKVSDLLNDGRRVECSYPHKLPNGSTKMMSIIRSPRDICIVSAVDDVPLNSREFFSRIKKSNTPQETHP